MLRVAVLGANGFIGSRVVEMLHLGGLAEVRPIVRSLARLARPSRFDLDCRIADGFDEPALRAAFEKCDAVVHAIAGDPAAVRGTLAPVYHAAQKRGVKRIIYLSTASVFGQAPPPGTHDDSPLNSKQALPYNNAKVRAERILNRLRERGSVELVVLRPGIVFGPRSSWVTTFVEALLAGQAYMVNEGHGVCNSAYVDNVVHAIHLAMTTPGIDGQAVIIGDKEKITWAEFYHPFAAALGCNLGDVHRVPSALVAQPANGWLEAISISPHARAVFAILPRRVRRALSGIRRLLTDPVPPRSPWTIPEAPPPRATLEMSLLHQCGYKLPLNKAEKLLHYDPMVSFAEGCRRTILWLAFAGYPVREPPVGC